MTTETTQPAAFIVSLTNSQQDWFLRGTTWAGSKDRAQRFATRDDARAALAKAKPFTRPALFKLARIDAV